MNQYIVTFIDVQIYNANTSYIWQHLNFKKNIYSPARQERQAYYKRRADAMANPQAKISVIIDGMDQAKTNIPHFKGWRAPKVTRTFYAT